jgi:hypothetical protein
MKYNKLFIAAALFVALVTTGCVNSLDIQPLDPKLITADVLFNNPANYYSLLAKCYAGLTISGQSGSSGSPDISSSDQGVATFSRTLWTAEENGTDEVLNGWGDGGLIEFHSQDMSNLNTYDLVLYDRIYFNIAVCNEFIRQVDSRLSTVPDSIKGNVTQYLAEARYLRALYYYYAMDLWGNVPFVTDKDAVGAGMPAQIKRADLFAYIESELKAISPSLLPANQNPQYYGRANKAADWMLLAKMYLNAQVYTGTSNYNACITYCDSIMNAGYSLNPKYSELFLADNNATCLNEIIFPIVEDGTHSQNYGGTCFIINASEGGTMDPSFYGIAGGWSGNMTTSTFINKFSDPSGITDQRAMFYEYNYPTPGQNSSITPTPPPTAATAFTPTLAVDKFRNVTSTGAPGANSTFPDTDFPLFRLADVYLMYAEATVRGGDGNMSLALQYVNDLRTRAYGNTSGNITSTDLTLPFILDERGRELYWEATRRTDLIRFGEYSNGDYMWDWKGGVINGKATSATNDLYPIPAADMTANSNLVQNPGY